MNGTIYMPVGEVCSSISDTYREKKNMVTLINTSDVLEGRVLNHERVPNSNLKGQFKKTFQRDDILYSEIRPQNRRFAYVDFSPIDYIASTKLMVIRAKKDVVSPKYLYYFLKNSSTVAELQLLAETRSGTFPQITFSEVANLTIPVPSLAVQEVIVQTMQCLEDKITCNEQINNNLQQQLRTIFKAAFTDNPELENITQIPLSELCHVVTKGTTPTTLGKPFVESGINFIKAESILDDHSIDKSKFAFIDEETNALLKRSIIHVGDVVFTIAGTLGRFALIDENVLPANTNQAVAIIRADVEKVSPEHIYTCFIGEWHTDYYAKRVQQAVQANLSLTTIKSLPIPLLDEAKMSKYLSLILPLIKAIKTNETQNEKLAALRDILLPKLMSGEIDVSAVQL